MRGAMRLMAAAGCAFSCWMPASVWPRRRSSSLSGKVGFNSTSAYRSSDSPSRADNAFMPRNERSSEEETLSEAPSDSARSAISGEVRGAGLGLRVGGIARVGNQREVDHRRVVPLDHHDVEAVGETRALRRR